MSLMFMLQTRACGTVVEYGGVLPDKSGSLT